MLSSSTLLAMVHGFDMRQWYVLHGLLWFYGLRSSESRSWLCFALQWRHNGCDSISNHQPHDCLLNRLFRCRSMKTSKLRVTGLCAGNSSGTGEFPAQMASNAEKVSIWWRHHGLLSYYTWIEDCMWLLSNWCFGITAYIGRRASGVIMSDIKIWMYTPVQIHMC